MKKLVREYGDFEYEDFIDTMRSEWDNNFVTFSGTDYMPTVRRNKRTGKPEWYFADALECCTVANPKPLTATYGTLDELLSAPVFDGKTIAERYDEMEKCNMFWIEDGTDS